jgi:predicted DNA-binding transcriptional regulator AlpA
MAMELLNARDVSKLLKVSLPLVYRMAEREQLACVRWECPGEGEEKPRTMVRFKLEDVRDFIEEHYKT